MATKERLKVFLVYQDCPFCGQKGKTLKKLTDQALEENESETVEVVKRPFTYYLQRAENKAEAKRAIFSEAVAAGVGSLPFFTNEDETVFASTLADLLEKIRAREEQTE